MFVPHFLTISAQAPNQQDKAWVKPTELTPPNERAFCWHWDGAILGNGVLGRGTAATKAQNGAVLNLADIVDNPKLNDEQKAPTVRKAVTHHGCRK